MSTATPPFHYLAELPPTLEPGAYTFDDYMQLPEGEPVELIRGNLVMSPAPQIDHQVVLSELHSHLRTCAAKVNALALFAPVDVRFANDTVVQPDIVYLADRKRGIGQARVEGAPDLLVEVVSPFNKSRDRKHKLAIYAEYGVPEYWIVDITQREITYLILKAGEYSIQVPKATVYQSPQLAEVTIDEAEFWNRIAELSS